jgi:hypothetical protein
MLQASPDLLPSLYDGRPKIMVVKSRASSWTFVRPTDALAWFVASVSDGGDFILTGADGGTVGIDRRPIELPPANVWIVWSPDGAAPVAGLADWWSRVGGAEAGPIFVHGDSATLSAALFECSLAEISRLTRANQLLIEDLAVLRENRERDVRLPSELQELLVNLRVAPPRLVFETPAANCDTGIPATRAVDDGPTSISGLRQRLPMGARGLLGIDLHVSAPGTGDGVLEVALVAQEAAEELARWRIPYRDLDVGWLPLRLPAASALTWRSLELRVHATAGTAPRLSCAPTGLLGEYAYVAPAGDSPSGTMLAFKLWGGIPGLEAAAGFETAPLPANPVVAILDHVIAAARSTRDLTWAYPYFGYIDRGQVLLRPLRVVPPSAACISLPAMRGLAAVSCEARIDDALCRTRLLVRLVATRPGHGADDAEQGVGVVASSEWIELAEPLKPFALAARLPAPKSGPVDLHFFSRLPEGGTLDHGRVIFSHFEAELDERAAWMRAPVMPETKPG